MPFTTIQFIQNIQPIQYYFLFWIVCVKPTNAFLPIISQKIIISNLETIISTKALSESFFSSVKREIDIERLLLQFMPMNTHINISTLYVYVSIILTVLYGQWRYYNGAQTKYDKFRKIDKFSREERFIKNLLFLMIMIFMKDIESAT